MLSLYDFLLDELKEEVAMSLEYNYEEFCNDKDLIPYSSDADFAWTEYQHDLETLDIMSRKGE